MSALGLGLGLGLGRSQVRGGESPDMILVYEIPDPNTPIQIAIQANSRWFSAGEAAVINWGDGSANQPVSDTGGDTYIGHTYTAAGTYTIKISGSMKIYGRINDDNILGETLLTRVDSFGKLGITSLAYAFYKCGGLMAVPKTVPDGVTNMSDMFHTCRGAAFNPDVTNWDVSNVTNMYAMFTNCSGDAFNPNVSNWNVSEVTNMGYMFYNCRGDTFNPDVSKWDVSNVGNMAEMFRYCYGDAFNPDVSKWDVSNVGNMAEMFTDCYGAAFNPDMKSWTLRTGVNTTNMFLRSKTQPIEWLDELLVKWAANPDQGNNITIDFSPNKFTAVEGAPLQAVADALEYLTTTKGWNITTANPYSST